MTLNYSRLASGLPTEGSVLDPCCVILSNFVNTYWETNDSQAGRGRREGSPAGYLRYCSLDAKKYVHENLEKFNKYQGLFPLRLSRWDVKQTISANRCNYNLTL